MHWAATHTVHRLITNRSSTVERVFLHTVNSAQEWFTDGMSSGEAQIQLVEAQEKERVAAEHALELNSRLTAVESQLATYRQDKSRLEATLEVERAQLEAAEEARSR